MDSNIPAFKTPGHCNFEFFFTGIWPRRRLQVRNYYYFRIVWVGWGARVSICSIDILSRRKMFYIRGKPWLTTFLPQAHLPPSCWNSFMPLQSAKCRAFIRPYDTQESTYLIKKKFPELRAPGCRFGVFLVTTLRSHVLIFFCLCLYAKCSLICYYRKATLKHYMVTS